MIPLAQPPFTWSLPKQLSLFPQMKKVLKGKCLDNMEEVKQKMAEALKGTTIDESFHNVPGVQISADAHFYKKRLGHYFNMNQNQIF